MKKEWVLFGVYRPPTQPFQIFLDNHYSPNCNNFMLIHDFNAEETEDNVTNFVKSLTSFKSNSTKCIDLISTNGKKAFKN